MTEPSAISQRTIYLRLRSEAGPAAGESLRKLSRPADVRCRGLMLEIDYPFPSLCMVEIWNALANAGIADQLSAGSRLRCRMRAFLEQNERDRLNAQRGWHHHAREIHARYYERRRLRTVDARRQQWRKLDAGTRD
ncbi:MAG: hypothetical protein HYY48_06890 [Gammaproteobacteria bacterium]|nr:hypothetical protein [Gammaproteobacteria bacterium]